MRAFSLIYIKHIKATYSLADEALQKRSKCAWALIVKSWSHNYSHNWDFEGYIWYNFILTIMTQWRKLCSTSSLFYVCVCFFFHRLEIRIGLVLFKCIVWLQRIDHNSRCVASLHNNLFYVSFPFQATSQQSILRGCVRKEVAFWLIKRLSPCKQWKTGEEE